MLKMAGLIGIIISSGMLGVLQALKLTERIRLLEDFMKMVLDLKGQMNYFRIPLAEIFMKTSKKGQTAAFQLLMKSESGLREKHGEIKEIWAHNAASVYRNTPLTRKDREIISELGTFIGQSDFENQKLQFEWLETELKIQLEEARQAAQQKGPMYRRLGFFGGILTALILI